jgi:hypothetical protein
VVRVPKHFAATWLEGKNDRISGLDLTSCFTSRIYMMYKNIKSERKVPVQKGCCIVTSVTCLWGSLPTLTVTVGTV